MSSNFTQTSSDAQMPPDAPTPLSPEQLSASKKYVSKTGLMYFFGAVIFYAVQLAAIGLMQAFRPEWTQNATISMIVQMAPIYLIAMPIMAVLIRRVPGRTLQKHKMTAGQWLIAFLICFAGMYLSNYVGVLITQLIGALKGSAVTNGILEVATSTSLLFNFIVMVLIAPVFEEYLFRKLLIDRLVKFGDATAVLFSGLMFGLFHGNLNQFVYAFVLGALFGFIYVRTGELRYTIGLHMAINFVGSILGVLILRLIDYKALLAASSSGDTSLIMEYAASHAPQLLAYMLYVLALLGIVIAGVILFFVSLKKFVFLPGEITLPKGKRFSTMILNVGMGLYFLYWIAIIILQLFE